LANSIKKIFQRAIKLSSVSEEIHQVIFNLCVLITPIHVEFDTLMKSLNKNFKPIKSYIAARQTQTKGGAEWSRPQCPLLYGAAQTEIKNSKNHFTEN
jgi:uncharacterized coiled-coil DUF342 family protein